MAIHWLRAYNFFYFSLFSIFLSFLPIYFASEGVSKTEIGLLIGLGGLVGMLSQPLWGIVSDHLKTIKNILLLLILLSVGIGTVLFQTSNLSLLFLLTALMYFFFMPTDPLVESLNVQITQQHVVNYGAVRMFGAMGYAAASLVVGFAGEHFGGNAYYVLFTGYGLVALLLGLQVPDVTASSSRIRLQDMGKFLRERRTLLFFSLLFIMSIPHRMNDIFVGLYVQELGGEIGQVGLTWTVMTLSEVIFFAVSHRFIRKGREIYILSIAALCYAVRFLLCYMLAHPAVVVGLQLLQGVSFVLFYAASIQYLYRIIPDEWKATGQTLLAVLFFGVSGVIGSSIGGWLFDSIGGRYLYLIMALISGMGFIYSLIIRNAMEHTSSLAEQTT